MPRPILLGLSLLTTLAAQGPPTPPKAGTAGPEAFRLLRDSYDKDRDGKVTRAEYPRTDTAFRNLDRDGNGVLEAADFRADTRRETRPTPPRPDPKLALPKVGDPAPDFELPMLGMKDVTVKLSSLRGDRPVALIFGSYT